MPTQTIITLNIRYGGGPRVSAILGYLKKVNAELVCLTEFREGQSGKALLDGLNDLGYGHYKQTEAEPGQNTVAFVSKCPFEPSGITVPFDIDRHVLPVKWKGLLVLGVYFPQGKAKAPVFDWLLRGSQDWLKEKAIIIGDFNTGIRYLDEEGATFLCSDKFKALVDLGWTDSFRKFHGNERKYTWFSNHGNGFRIDHAFTSAAVEILTADYDDSCRTRGITDHSSTVLTLEI